MDYKLLVDIAVMLGEIMLMSGAETYRVEDTISRILKLSEFEKTEAFVTSTGIMVTLDDRSIDAISLVKRVKDRTINLNNIYIANNISRKLCKREIELFDAYERLKSLYSEKSYKESTIQIATVFSTIFFVVMLGGRNLSLFAAFINGIYITVFRILSKKFYESSFMTCMISAFFIAVSTFILGNSFKLPIDMKLTIIGSIMPMVPGVPITNAVRDTLMGDFVSGGARGIEAFITAASIAVGIGGGLAMYSYFAGGILEWYIKL